MIVTCIGVFSLNLCSNLGKYNTEFRQDRMTKFKVLMANMTTRVCSASQAARFRWTYLGSFSAQANEM